MDGNIDFSFGEDYTGAGVSSSGIFDSFPSVTDVVGAIGTAGLSRAMYEINKPMLDPKAQAKKPGGLLGNVGTFGFELGPDTRNLLIVALLAIGGFVFYKYILKG